MDEDFHSGTTGGNRVVRIPLSNDRDCSIAGWFRRTASVTSVKALLVWGEPVGDTGTPTTEDRGIGLYIVDNTTLRVFVNDGTTRLFQDFAVDLSNWQYVTASVDSAADLLTVYVGTTVVGTLDISTLDTAYLRSKHRVAVAHVADLTSNQRFAPVEASRVAWWDETTTAAEVAELVAGPEPTFTGRGSATLVGSALFWGGAGQSIPADWDDQGSTITSYSVVVKRNGTSVGSPAQALSGSLDISGFGAGDYTVEQTATNAGGESSAAVTPPVTYTADVVNPPEPSGLGLVTWWGLTEDPNLVGRWQGDGDSDGSADPADSVSGDLAAWNGSPAYTSGPFHLGNAFAVGSGAFLRLGSPTAAPTLSEPRTLSLWIRPTQVASNRGLLSYASGSDGAELTLHLSDGELEVDWGGHTVRTVNAQIEQDTWTSIAVVIDDPAVSTNDARIYVNGSEAQVATTGGTAKPLATGSVNIRLGASTDEVDRFAGELWDVRLYSRALAAEELIRHDNGPEPRPINPPRCALVGSQMSWASNQSDWNDFANGPVELSSVVRRYGQTIVDEAMTSLPGQGLVDLSVYGYGVFDVVVTANSSGGTDELARSISDAVVYPAPSDADAAPPLAGVCRTSGAAVGLVVTTAVDSF